jgi:hypothetical protein
MDSTSKETNPMMDLCLKMAKAGWEGYFHWQQEWLGVIGMNGKTMEPGKLEPPGQEVLKEWYDIYEKEFRKFLTVPQLGLMRFYQERMGEVFDKFNLFQARISEFVSVLLFPMEKSFGAMREKIEKLAQEGKVPENPKRLLSNVDQSPGRILHHVAEIVGIHPNHERDP